MSKLYCQNCFEATEYSLNKPRVCCYCATPFGGVASAPKPQPAPVKPKVIIKHDEDDYDDEPASEILPDISKLEVEVTHARKSGVTFKDLIAQGPVTEKFSRPKDKKTSKKAFLKEFQEEAGTLRRDKREKEDMNDQD